MKVKIYFMEQTLVAFKDFYFQHVKASAGSPGQLNLFHFIKVL